MTSKERLFLVDGSSLAFRSFYALLTTGMRTKTGVPTWAVLGFFNSLFDMIDKYTPHRMAVCFDLSGPTFRHEAYEHYKANRQEMPDDLALQWPLIKQGVATLGIPVLELKGFEADDIIGTVAKQAAKEDQEVTILTGDQDIFQLIEEGENHIEVLMPSRNEGLKSYRRQEVFDKLGVWPEQIIDYKALCGDSSDNIPGVKGIGPKTAVKLLSEYGNLDNVYASIESISSKSVKNKLLENKESAYASRILATIVLDAPVDFDFNHCLLDEPDVLEVGKFFKSLQFRTLVARIPAALASFTGNGDTGQAASVERAANIANALENLNVAPLTLDEISGRAVGVDSESGPPERSGTIEDTIQTVSLVDQSLEAAPTISIQIPKFDSAPSPMVVENESQLDDLVAILEKQEVIAVDLETMGVDSLSTDIVGWAFAWGGALSLTESGRIALEQIEDNQKSEKLSEISTAYIPVRHQHLAAIQLEPEYVSQKLKPILESKSIAKIAQNGKFEMNVLSRIEIALAPLSFDPMLASYIVNPDDKHGLKDQCERILGYKMEKITEIIGSGRKQITMNLASVERVAPYAADDARITLALAGYYAQKLDETQKYLMYEMELPLSVVLARMEQTGVAIDVEYLKKFSTELAAELLRLEKEIFADAGYEFNINSTQQLQKVLFEELGLETKTKTKTGYSTDASVLESLRHAHPIIARILDYRHISKLRSTYVDALPKQVLPHDGRLHGEFNQTVASTGRLSSSNPNLQNIPIRTELGRRIRKAFVPAKPSWSLIAADYSQIELRMLAHMSQDETLIDAFEKNQDIHARTAMEIFEVPMESVDSDKRRVGKTINFALVYQQGAFATAQDLGISTKEAQEFIDKYFSRYPRVKGFLTGTIEQARQDNFVTTLWGRRRYFRHLQDRNANIRRGDERAACNAPIQGSAADLIKLAMIELDKTLKESGLRARLILQVHDELVLEVPDEEIESLEKILRQSMELSQPLRVPLVVDFGVGKDWMDTK